MLEAELELLVLEVQAGNSSALGKLYKNFHLSMKKYAVLRVNDSMIAEDLVQNVWLKVSRRIGHLNDVSLFRSWLYRALRWEIIDWIRKSRKEDITDTFEEDKTVNEQKNNSIVLPAISQLEENQREIVELFYLSELTIEEISLILEKPQGTIKSRLYRARKQLKVILENS